jgi:hypothetical protein
MAAPAASDSRPINSTGNTAPVEIRVLRVIVFMQIASEWVSGTKDRR